MFPEFKKFKSIPRLLKECLISEKLDGSNGLIYIDENNHIFVGSRNRWLWASSQDEIYNDNHGFAFWVKNNEKKLLKLGQGYHYGEWVGKKIQRSYGLEEKKFYLFNINKWHKKEPRLSSIDNKTKEEKYTEECPKCCEVVPVLFEGLFTTENIEMTLARLKEHGSYIASFMNPEGIIIYHKASGYLFKKTFDDNHKNKKREFDFII